MVFDKVAVHGSNDVGPSGVKRRNLMAWENAAAALTAQLCMHSSLLLFPGWGSDSRCASGLLLALRPPTRLCAQFGALMVLRRRYSTDRDRPLVRQREEEEEESQIQRFEGRRCCHGVTALHSDD